jgi:hypothetical protein
MADNKPKNILGQIFFAVIISVITYFVFQQFKPQSESQKMLDEAYTSFKKFKDASHMKDATINAATLVYQLDPSSKEAKECKEWAIQQGTTIDNLIKEDSIKRTNAPKYTQQEMDSISKAANNYLLYHGIAGNADEAFEKIHIAFGGMPDIEKVKPLLEAVMNRYKIVINNDNVLKVANVLVALKNESKVGVTEMEILKHIYQNGLTGVDYPTQAGLSAGLLEQYK